MPVDAHAESESSGVRAHVADSWLRSAAAGVHVDTVDAPITLPADSLRDHREAHPLARVFPLLDDVLGQAARDCDAVMAVSDASGQLLWVCGTPSVLRRAESIGFVEGSNWDERLAGTNAPGMALRLDESVHVIGAEHFRRSVQRWSCAATTIHDPSDQTSSASSTSPVVTTSWCPRRWRWSGPPRAWPSPSSPGSCSSAAGRPSCRPRRRAGSRCSWSPWVAATPS